MASNKMTGFEYNVDKRNESRRLFKHGLSQFKKNLEANINILEKDKVVWRAKLKELELMDTQIRIYISQLNRHSAKLDDIKLKERKNDILTEVRKLCDYLNKNGFFNVDNKFNDVTQKGRALWSKHRPATAERLADVNEGVTMESTLAGQLFDAHKNWGLDFVFGDTNTPACAFWSEISDHAANLLKDTVHVYTFGNPVPGTVLINTELDKMFEKMKSGEVRKVKIHIGDLIDIDERLPIYLFTNATLPGPAAVEKPCYIINTDTFKVSKIEENGNHHVLKNTSGSSEVMAKETFEVLQKRGNLPTGKKLKGGGLAVQAARLLISGCDDQKVPMHIVERKVVSVVTEDDVMTLLRVADDDFKAAQGIGWKSGEAFEEELKKESSLRTPVRDISLTYTGANSPQHTLFLSSSAASRIASKKTNTVPRELHEVRSKREKIIFDSNVIDGAQIFTRPTSLTVNPSRNDTVQFIFTLPNGARAGFNVAFKDLNDVGKMQTLASELINIIEEKFKEKIVDTNVRLDVYYAGSSKMHYPVNIKHACDNLKEILGKNCKGIEMHTKKFPHANDKVYHGVTMEDKQMPGYHAHRPRLK